MGSAWAPVLAGAEVVPESPLAGSPSSAHLGPRDHADFCYLPSVCGNCKALFIRFFYNASSQRCEEFIYGGCGGNRNNFETKRECFQCPALVASPVLQSDICHLPPEHGPCRGHFYRYAYNPATGTCRVFLYGGCRGNANNFETLKECQRACQRGERRALGWTGDPQAGPWIPLARSPVLRQRAGEPRASGGALSSDCERGFSKMKYLLRTPKSLI
uniref:BPTI/Kunitz inhibitor domain-containing protein n=1 Tax=Anser brachyrhynchus TaxID=132585 RepID=A0A8B9BUV6_9AVES